MQQSKENIKFGVFDIEANSAFRNGFSAIHFLLLGFFDGTTYKEFRSVEKFLSFVNHKQYNGFRFYAHNGGKFDVLFLLQPIFDLGWNIKIIERTGRVLALHVDTGKVRFTISDSYALLPNSLDDLGKAFNVTHKKTKGVSWKRDHEAKEPRLRAYLENDCLCLYEIITAFFSSEFVVHPQTTIASQALDTFRSIFLDSKLVRFPLEHETYFRDNWYSGGRVEVYKGAGNVHGYDVNSLFPFAMLNEMPSGEAISTKSYHKDCIGFYRVWIDKLPAFYVSPLLIKRQNGNANENLFVNGKGEYFLSSDCLEYLAKTYGIRFRVIDGFYFKKKEYLFNDYVKTFYKVKQEHSNNAKGYIAKRMLNHLYGKLGQTRWKETVEMWTSETRHFVQFDNDFGLVLVVNRSKSRFILPYLAAYITDLARLYHFQLMNMVSDSMFYCDTDSLFTGKKLSTRLVGEKIGQLHYLGKFNGIFLAPKSYALKAGRNEEIKFKGFDSEQFSFFDFKKQVGNVLFDGLQMKKKRILSFRECLTRKTGIIAEASPFLKVVESKKHVKTQYDKRIIIPDSKFIFDTMPLNWFPRND